MINLRRKLRAFVLLMPFAWASAAHADAVDCNNTSGEIEAAICNNQEFSQLAALADALGTIVGLEVKYLETSVNGDFGIGRGVGRLLSALTFSEAHNLAGLSQGLPWDFVFDVPNKILVIRAETASLQDALVVFDPSAAKSSTPIYVELETLHDAVRHHYRSVGDILEIRSNARPAETVEKYRHQDGCWRLIGTDTVWAGYMIEFNDDLAVISINHLTGRAIFDFKEAKGVVRTLDPQVRCLNDRFTYQEFKYHDADGQ